MKRADSDIVLDTPSCLLRGLGVTGRILLIPRFSRTLIALSANSYIVPVSSLDDIVRRERPYRILHEAGHDGHVWECIRLRDEAGSVVECLAFECHRPSEEYYCELRLAHGTLLWLSVAALRLSPHMLLPGKVLWP